MLPSVGTDRSGVTPVTMQAAVVPEPLQRALRRLGSAIDHLEAAAARRAEADATRGNLDDELAVMQDDRARLAADLDGALARGRTLAQANGDVGQRLAQASAVVRDILDEMARSPTTPSSG